MKLSIIIPVYNERFLVLELLRRVLALEISGIDAIEVLVIDDGSDDGTRELLREFTANQPRIRYIEHQQNHGKGAAIRTGVAAATGDLTVFQDADLEYDPRDFARMVRPFLEDGADVVYGSRYLPSERRRVLYFRHTTGNRFLTLLSNWFTDLSLTDMETCYKMFRTPLLKSLPIRSNDFAMEPEITAKVAKRDWRLFEVPISYLGRTYREGKKIGWRDGFKALRAILTYWLIDDLYTEDAYGSHMLYRLERVHRFNRWMAETVEPYVGARVLELGAGLASVTTWLLPRDLYVASEVNPLHLHYLGNFATGKPYLEVQRIDPEDVESVDQWRGRFDTVVSLDQLEKFEQPRRALQNLAAMLEPGGRLVLYVPQGERRFCALDEALGQRRRYSRSTLSAELEHAGFEVERLRDFNRLAAAGWFVNGKLLRRKTFGRYSLKVYNALVPLLRRFDRFVPLRGLGLIAVARKTGVRPLHPEPTVGEPQDAQGVH